MSSRTDTPDPASLVETWFIDLFTDGALDVADDILAADVTYTGPRSLSPSDIEGPDDVKEYVETYRQAFPDLTYEVEETFETEAGIVARWSATGTQENALFDLASSGEAFAVAGINVFRIEDGRITDVSAEWDTLKMVQELGVVSGVGGVE